MTDKTTPEVSPPAASPARTSGKTRARPKASNGNGPHGLKLTDELAAKICQAIRTGATLEGSAAYAGVARQTFFDWLRRGRQANARNPYKGFVADVEEALGVVEVANITRISKAGQDEWTANAWILERRFPDRYGRRTRVDGNLQVQAIVASPEWVGLRDRMLAALAPYPEALAAVVAALAPPPQEDEIHEEVISEVIGELAAG